MQAELPFAAENVPATQAAQAALDDDAPTVVPYVPAEQFWQ